MSFLKDFAQGFFETSATTLTDRKKLNDEVDAKRKTAVALVDPQMALYKRQKDADLEFERQKSEQENEQFSDFLSRMGGNPNAVPTPGTGTPGMDNLFGSPTATPPVDLGAVHQQLQEALKYKSAAQASGNTKMAQFYDTRADSLKSQYTYLVDSAKNEGKLATGAEGGNIVEGIEKRFTDESKPGSAAVSRYMPTKLNKFVNDPSIRTEHESSKNKHKALAQAVAGAKKEHITAATPEVSDLIVDGTEKVIRNINVLNSSDPGVSPDEKKQAAQEIENYFNGFSPIEKERLMNDVNFKSVFDDSTIQTINSLLHADDTSTSTTPEGEAAPVELKPKATVKEGARAVNKKTGEKLVYMGGKWITPDEMREIY